MKKKPAKLHLEKQYEKDSDALYDALRSLESRHELRAFFKDLCTPAEIRAFAERWRVACLLDERKLSYRDIREQTGVSLATIGRVARFLMHEPHHGYIAALKKRKKLSKS
ncbi:MAG: YerC/YecD family TrpR-related protein [Pseudomonadota bacterium]